MLWCASKPRQVHWADRADFHACKRKRFTPVACVTCVIRDQIDIDSLQRELLALLAANGAAR